jgi:hypothetical protein
METKNQQVRKASQARKENVAFKPKYKVVSANFGANRMSARSCRCRPGRC